MRSPAMSRPGEKYDPRNPRHLYIDPKSMIGRQIREITHGLGSNADMARLRNMIIKYKSCPSGGKALQDWAAKHTTGDPKADRAKMEWFQNHLMLARRFFQWIENLDPHATLFADAATHRAIQAARMQISHPIVNQAVQFFPAFKKQIEDAEKAEVRARAIQKEIAVKLQGRQYANRDIVDRWVQDRQKQVEHLSQQAFLIRRQIDKAYTSANLRGYHGERGVRILADVDGRMWRLQKEVKDVLKAHVAAFRDLKKKYQAAHTRFLAGDLMFKTYLNRQGMMVDQKGLRQADSISYWAQIRMNKLKSELEIAQRTIRGAAEVAKLKIRQARQHIKDNQGVPFFERFGNQSDPANQAAADRAAVRLYNLFYRPRATYERIQKEKGGYEEIFREIQIPRDAFGRVSIDLGTLRSIEEHVEKSMGPQLKRNTLITAGGENLGDDFRDRLPSPTDKVLDIQKRSAFVPTGLSRKVEFVKSSKTRWKITVQRKLDGYRVDMVQQIQDDAGRRKAAEDDAKRRDIAYGTEDKRRAFYKALGITGSPKQSAYLDKILAAGAGKARSEAFYTFGRVGMIGPTDIKDRGLAYAHLEYLNKKIEGLSGRKGLARAGPISQLIEDTLVPMSGRAAPEVQILRADLARRVEALAGKGVYGTLPDIDKTLTEEGQSQVMSFLKDVISRSKAASDVAGERDTAEVPTLADDKRATRFQKRLDKAGPSELDELTEAVLTIQSREEEGEPTPAPEGEDHVERQINTASGRLGKAGWVPNRPDLEPGALDTAEHLGTPEFQTDDQENLARWTDAIDKSKRNRYRPS